MDTTLLPLDLHDQWQTDRGDSRALRTALRRLLPTGLGRVVTVPAITSPAAISVMLVVRTVSRLYLLYSALFAVGILALLAGCLGIDLGHGIM